MMLSPVVYLNHIVLSAARLVLPVISLLSPVSSLLSPISSLGSLLSSVSCSWQLWPSSSGCAYMWPNCCGRLTGALKMNNVRDLGPQFMHWLALQAIFQLLLLEAALCCPFWASLEWPFSIIQIQAIKFQLSNTISFSAGPAWLK